MPIAMITIAVSGLGVLVRDRKETRNLIIINWVLYVIPAAIAIWTDVTRNPSYFGSLHHPLGFYPIYLCVFVQFAMLIDKNSFLSWAGFSEESKKENDGASLAYRKVVAILFLLIFTYTFGIPLFGLLTQDDHYQVFGHVWTAIPILICWYIFGEINGPWLPPMGSLKTAASIVTSWRNRSVRPAAHSP